MSELFNQLWPHQQTVVQRFLRQNKLYVNLDVGLGKTRIALVSALMRNLNLFVLAPLSAIPSWIAENSALGNPFHVIHYTGQSGVIKFDRLNLVIMNYERFRSSWQVKFDENKLRRFLIVL
ncbi:MAG: DEAD/DEAH box helicase family protein, partial [Candidatus Paceibacteria bacterium]